MPDKIKLDRRIIGGTGLSRTGFVYEDFIPNLNGQNAIRAYREMSNNDPVLFGILYAIETLLRGVAWRVEEAKGEGINEKDAKEAAEFLRQVMFEDMSHPWEDFISEVLSFLTYGHDVHEIVWKIRGGTDTTDPTKYSRYDDMRIGIRKLAPRSQDTLWQWQLQDDSGLAGVFQQLPESGQRFLPVDKILLFRTTTTKANPEGRSILRGCYVSYQRKQAIEIAEGRAAMRSAGVVQLAIPAAFLSPSADADQVAVRNAYQRVADQLAQDRQGSVVIPSDRDDKGNALFSVSYIATDGRRPADMTNVIERFDKRMASSVLADFMLLGQQAVGSFALSSDKTQLFAKSLSAYLSMIAAPLNRVLVPRLWALNQFDPALMPKLVPGDVSQRALGELGTFVKTLKDAGFQIAPDLRLENALRDAGELPPKDDKVIQEQEEHAQQQAEMFATPGQPGADGGDGEDDPKAKAPSNTKKPGVTKWEALRKWFNP